MIVRLLGGDREQAIGHPMEFPAPLSVVKAVIAAALARLQSLDPEHEDSLFGIQSPPDDQTPAWGDEPMSSLVRP